MSGVVRFIVKEFREALPPIVFFLIGFNLVEKLYYEAHPCVIFRQAGEFHGGDGEGTYRRQGLYRWRTCCR